MMSVAAGWNLYSQSDGCAAQAEAAENNAAAAPIPPAMNLFIALIISLARTSGARIIQLMPERESRTVDGGSNHTLFPSARKDRAHPCGIFARGIAAPRLPRCKRILAASRPHGQNRGAKTALLSRPEAIGRARILPLRACAA
jgi:hypothetical protein